MKEKVLTLKADYGVWVLAAPSQECGFGQVQHSPGHLLRRPSSTTRGKFYSVGGRQESQVAGRAVPVFLFRGSGPCSSVDSSPHSRPGAIAACPPPQMEGQVCGYKTRLGQVQESLYLKSHMLHGS